MTRLIMKNVLTMSVGGVITIVGIVLGMSFGSDSRQFIGISPAVFLLSVISVFVAGYLVGVLNERKRGD